MELALPVKLLISLGIGAAIGIEREVNEKTKLKPTDQPSAILGLRSYSLIAILGSLTGFLYSQHIALAILLGGLFGILTISYYIIDTLRTKNPGVTTELAAFFTFFTGAMIAVNALPIQIILAATVGVLILLTGKDEIKKVVTGVRENELQAFISYAIVALMILPFLPNTAFTIGQIPVLGDVLQSFGVSLDRVKDIELINPFKLWLIVALITGVDLIGYVLERTLGQKKGWLLASAAGGFVSSTATTLALAQQSKTVKVANHLVAAAIIANLVSFIQIGILLTPVNGSFLTVLVPTLLAIIVAAAVATVFFLRAKTKETKKAVTKDKKSDHTIFNIVPALKFAAIFLTVQIVSRIALELFGSSGFLLTSAIAALTGIDAVMINTATLAGNAINFKTAILAFIIVNAVNLIGKSVYSFLQGSREFAVKFSITMAALIAVSLVGLFFG